jgi:uncharacterized lipoprotein YehR (DUF1307 family)
MTLMKRLFLSILLLVLTVTLCACSGSYHTAKEGDLNISIPVDTSSDSDEAIKPFLGKWNIESISDENGTDKPENSYYVFGEDKEVEYSKVQNGKTVTLNFRYKVNEDRVIFTHKESQESIKGTFVFNGDTLTLTFPNYTHTLTKATEE